MITPHTTGHAIARDGSLLRVDVMAGRWAATKYTANLVVAHRVVGTAEYVHQQIGQWCELPENAEHPLGARAAHKPHPQSKEKEMQIITRWITATAFAVALSAGDATVATTAHADMTTCGNEASGSTVNMDAPGAAAVCGDGGDGLDPSAEQGAGAHAPSPQSGNPCPPGQYVGKNKTCFKPPSGFTPPHN
jgi:hypothetical protein